MSGGKFDYKDSAARWAVEEVLEEAIERFENDDSVDGAQMYRHATTLRAISEILFDWLHDYDWAASHDTSFDTLDRQAGLHIEHLLSALSESKVKPAEAQEPREAS